MAKRSGPPSTLLALEGVTFQRANGGITIRYSTKSVTYSIAMSQPAARAHPTTVGHACSVTLFSPARPDRSTGEGNCRPDDMYLILGQNLVRDRTCWPWRATPDAIAHLFECPTVSRWQQPTSSGKVRGGGRFQAHRRSGRAQHPQTHQQPAILCPLKHRV